MSVEKITDDQLDETLENNDKVAIKFFANWCGSCRLFAPKFKRMSESDEFEDIKFLDINAEENEKARKWAKVSNLPFFAVVKNGEIIESDFTSKEDKVKEMISKLN